MVTYAQIRKLKKFKKLKKIDLIVWGAIRYLTEEEGEDALSLRAVALEAGISDLTARYSVRRLHEAGMANLQIGPWRHFITAREIQA